MLSSLFQETRISWTDGFSTHFYKDSWGVVGEEISDDVIDFFYSGKRLKEVNNTILASIPKIKCPNVLQVIDL